jgi:hypothetical protein
MVRASHPKKEVEDAIKHAEANGQRAGADGMPSKE